jgi:hypothetical protein
MFYCNLENDLEVVPAEMVYNIDESGFQNGFMQVSQLY